MKPKWAQTQYFPQVARPTHWHPVAHIKSTAQLDVKTRLKCSQVTSCSIFIGFCSVFWSFSCDFFMLFHVVFLKKWTKFKWHHSFVHVARGYSEMHVFKCRWCFRYSEMAFLQRLTYFFFDFDFSHSNYIIVHGATAKCMFLMEIVVSPQRNGIL